MKSSTVQSQYTQTVNMFETASVEGGDFIARILIADILSIPLNQFVLHHKDTFSDAQLQKLDTYRKQILTGMPVAYVVGYQDFFGLQVEVNQSTLIPRPETEELIELVLAEDIQDPILLDVGTGSGCIPCVLGKYIHPEMIYICDQSMEALEIAQRNAKRHSLVMKSLHMDCTGKEFTSCVKNIFEKYSKKTIIVTANLPYIPTEEMKSLDKHVLNYEPHSALDGGNNGTDIIIALLSCLHSVYTSQIRVIIFLEIDPANVRSLSLFVEKTEGMCIRFIDDLSGHTRFAVCEFD